MTPDEIEASDDVDQLYTQLKAAKAFGDPVSVRLLERRLRELAGHNSRSDERKGKAVAADPAKVARVRSDSEASGGGG